MYKDKRQCSACGTENLLLIDVVNHAWRCACCNEPHWLGDIERISASVVFKCKILDVDNFLDSDITGFYAESTWLNT